MLDTDTIRRDLIGLLEQWTGRRHPVLPDTALYHDLGITGNHARDILTDIAKRYGTSFKGFKFSSYFPKESEPVWNKLARQIGVRRKLKRLTVRHLVAVIAYKSWFEPRLHGSKAERRSPSSKRPTDQRSA